MLNNLLLGQTAEEKLYVEDVFSTYLFTSTGTTQTITNNIDLSTKGGMVWCKNRSASGNHVVSDTVRGSYSNLATNLTDAAVGNFKIGNFSASGFDVVNSGSWLINGNIYASWTFRKAPKFFDVVTWSGNSTNRTISHSLGSVPGMIFVKRTDSAADWQVYHRSLANTEYAVLNTTAAKATGTTRWNSTTATDTVFSLGTDSTVNATGGSYVAYLFAHDTTADGVIQCGSFTTSGNNFSVNLGWEPQFLLLKNSNGAEGWYLHDNMRGLTVNGSNDAWLQANTSSAENSSNWLSIDATGFSSGTSAAYGGDWIYLAIRRGPMRVPTDATKVFMPTVYTGTNVDNRLVDTTIAPDTVWIRQRNSTTVGGMVVGDRLRGQPYLLTGTTAAEVNDADSFDQQLVNAVEYGTAFSSMSGVWVGNDVTSQLNASTTASNQIAEAFKRAPGFHDVVCYTGTGSSLTISHNLGVAPEFVIIKTRASAGNWYVATGFTSTNMMYGNLDNTSGYASATYADFGMLTAQPTSSGVPVTSTFSGNGTTYVMYLFASCQGVSKVNSYTGNGSSQNIDCGFTNGARFVLIRRMDGEAGDWYVWDSARGIVSGNDPHLSLNSTAAEVTNDDSVDALNAGFTVNQLSATNININSATYIYLAIA